MTALETAARLVLLAASLFITMPSQADELSDIRELTSDRKFAQALTQLDALIAEQPDNVEALLLKGVVLTRDGQVTAAIKTFDALAEQFPDLPEPHNNLAVLYASKHRYEDARTALLKALELQPRYDTAYENLGDIYAKLAAIAYDRAYQLNRTNERAKDKAIQLADTLSLESPVTSAVADPSAAPEAQATEIEMSALPAAESEVAVAIALPAPDKTCYSSSRLETEIQANTVLAWFSRAEVLARSRITTEPSLVGYQVYVPPLENKAAADVQIAAMRNQGIQDLFRISGDNLDNAIALGVYATEEAATRRAKSIRVLGYKPAVRERMREVTVWYVDAVSNYGVDRTSFHESFPTTLLTKRECAPDDG